MIVYSVHCDDCGTYICSSTTSARAAGADASMKHGANHGPTGDSCLACRKERTKLTTEQYIKAAQGAHGRGTGT